MKGIYGWRERIQRFKKVIAVIFLAVCVLLLGFYVIRLKGKVNELEETLVQVQSESGEESGIYTVASVETSKRDQAQQMQISDESADSHWEKRIYLTFDDGPSRNTNRILDILKEYDVKATFFVVGKTDAESVKAYQRIVEEGHTLAMHSYSHKYAEVYRSKESFVQDLEKLQEYLYQVTGVWTRYYRFPGGSSNTVSRADMGELIQYLEENGIIYFDWNIASGDAVSGELSKDTIIRNCVGGVEGLEDCMILMHDAAEKNSTVDALSQIIERIMDRGDAVFLPITDETALVRHMTVKE